MVQDFQGTKRAWEELDIPDSDDECIGINGLGHPQEPSTKAVKHTHSPPGFRFSGQELEYLLGPGPYSQEDELTRIMARESPGLLSFAESGIQSPYLGAPVFASSECQFVMPGLPDHYGWENGSFKIKNLGTIDSCFTGLGSWQRSAFEHSPFTKVVRLYFMVRSFTDPNGFSSPYLEVGEYTRLSEVFEWYLEKSYPGIPILRPEDYHDEQTKEGYYLMEIDLGTRTVGERWYYQHAKQAGLRLRDTEWWSRALRLGGKVWLVSCDRIPGGESVYWG